MATLYAGLNRTVARMCSDATYEEAEQYAERARARLARHRKSGEHSITVDRGRRSDAFVNLEGQAPGAVEFGHFDKNTGEWVPGIFALTGEV